ncbi:hypothetical protein TIFTF001_025382 [Ficus carica]|uniref:Uncharacterized protein n=1 Tax=Ficus carica TaxID=3494 RepID=A0AA88DH84_FICCA|nr:hypothetical protein TIFTF001_025382 [Ficus carica]
MRQPEKWWAVVAITGRDRHQRKALPQDEALQVRLGLQRSEGRLLQLSDSIAFFEFLNHRRANNLRVGLHLLRPQISHKGFN